IIGDMLELGNRSKQLHAEIGQKIAELKIDEVYGYGEEAAEIVKNCHSEFCGIFTQHADIIGEFIKRLEKGTLVLVKGSRGMKMEKIVQALVDKFKKD
ncbi:MAG TPA: UDP-N-acetylmuramoyl-tripeptide--D-alanyl-D-alanine ligase, partial [Bdellovibrionota bacterium]|nr:UDP-N-acetylmuramoyl-tripeptide--D-alanyl-D-alanine ligase [Bdellovibrionota bacterium]